MTYKQNKKIYQSLLLLFPYENWSKVLSPTGALPSKSSVNEYLAPISKPKTKKGFGFILKPRINGIEKLWSCSSLLIGFEIGIRDTRGMDYLLEAY